MQATDYLPRIPELAEVLQGQEPATRFSRSGATWTADPDGDPLLVRDVIAAAVGRWADPATGSFDPPAPRSWRGC